MRSFESTDINPQVVEAFRKRCDERSGEGFVFDLNIPLKKVAAYRKRMSKSGFEAVFDPASTVHCQVMDDERAAFIRPIQSAEA